MQGSCHRRQVSRVHVSALLLLAVRCQAAERSDRLFFQAQTACALLALAALAGVVTLHRLSKRSRSARLQREALEVLKDSWQEPWDVAEEPQPLRQQEPRTCQGEQLLVRRRPAAVVAELFDARPAEQLRRAHVPRPSSQASAVKRELLRSFPDLDQTDLDQGVRGAPPLPRGEGATEVQLRNFPELVLQACLRWHVTLLDVEALVLPSWGFDVTFSSRAAWHQFVGELRRRDFLGEIQGLRISYPDSSDARCHIQSARWVELLDGSVLARLMTDGRPTCVMPWAHPSSINAVLTGIRQVPWAAERSWMYPRWHTDRMVFISWIGKVLKLDPAWTAGVLPFLPIEARSTGRSVPSSDGSQVSRRPRVGNSGFDVGQAREGDQSLLRDVGQRVLYRSTTHRRWISCTVTRRDASSGSIMIDAKPGYWITLREQIVCIRAAQ